MTAFRHWLVFLLIWLLGGLAASAQDAKPLRGVALVIGQANYAHIAPLPNAGSDARAIGRLMTDLGFETRLAPDRNARALKREIERFIEDAEGADAAVVYYAGHGIEAGGENWLVPVDADLASLADARERLVASSQLVERLRRTVPVVIVLLDACRSSPFPPDALLRPDAGSPAAPVVPAGLMPARGMTALADQPASVENVAMLMGFAAEPGHAALDGPQGGHSPYAQALLRHLSALAGTEFGDVMTMVAEEVYLATETRQRPWVNASLRRRLYFGMAPEAGDKDETLITGERRRLLLTIAALPAAGRRQVEEIARSDAVPLASLYGMLRALGAEAPKDPAALDAVLRAQAEKLKSVLAENAVLKSSDPDIIRLSSLADRAVAEGAIETAVAFREQAKAKAASLAPTLDQTEAALAARRLELAEVYAKSGETYTLAFDFPAAAADFEQAFAQIRRWDEALAWKYKKREGESWAALGFFKGDKIGLDRARAAFEEAGRLVSLEDNPQEWIDTAAGLGLALRIQGEREPGTATLRQAVEGMEAALARRPGIEAEADWSILQNNLAVALWRLGEREPGTVSLEAASRAFEAALADVPADATPVSRALIENNLGVVLTAVGQRQSTSAAFDRAVTVLDTALARISREEARGSWAVMQNNLATALSYKGQRESGAETLERSAAAYRAAIGALDRQTAPLAWATATNNLGMVLLRLGQMQPGNDNLVAAAKEFAAALEEMTRERNPLDWAEVETNRGLAVSALGQREAGTERLVEAIAIFEAAMAVKTHEVSPLSWANNQMNLGVALFALGQRETGTRSLERAVAAFTAALTEITRDRAPLDWAATTINLGATLAAIGVREAGLDSFDRAADVFRRALATDFRAEMPSYWADIHFHLGNVLVEKARRETGTASLDEAEAVYRAAQTEMTRERSLIYWANLETSIATVHVMRGQRSDRRSEYEAARTSTLAAWDAYKAAAVTSQDADFAARLAQIDAAIADLE
ncbi:MAG: caspase family protein [Parvibaculaceae bacterium]